MYIVSFHHLLNMYVPLVCGCGEDVFCYVFVWQSIAVVISIVVCNVSSVCLCGLIKLCSYAKHTYLHTTRHYIYHIEQSKYVLYRQMHILVFECV